MVWPKLSSRLISVLTLSCLGAVASTLMSVACGSAAISGSVPVVPDLSCCARDLVLKIVARLVRRSESSLVYSDLGAI